MDFLLRRGQILLLTQILTQNGKDRGGGNGADSMIPSMRSEQTAPNRAGKGWKASLLPPGRIFTRRRSLVRVQQSPPRRSPCSPCAARVFCCFEDFWTVRQRKTKPRLVLPDVALCPLSGCMKLYGFSRCPRASRCRRRSRGCTLLLTRPPRRLPAAPPTAATAPAPAPSPAWGRRSLPAVAPRPCSPPPSPP